MRNLRMRSRLRAVSSGVAPPVWGNMNTTRSKSGSTPSTDSTLAVRVLMSRAKVASSSAMVVASTRNSGSHPRLRRVSTLALKVAGYLDAAAPYESKAGHRSTRL